MQAITKNLIVVIIITLIPYGCKKSTEKPVSPITNIQNTPINILSPLVGTWKLEKITTLPVYSSNFNYLTFVDAPGKDTCVTGNGVYDWYLDTITINQDGTVKGNFTSSTCSFFMSSNWNDSNSIFILNKTQINYFPSYVHFTKPMTYWFIKEPVGNKLTLTSPILHIVNESCGEVTGEMVEKIEINYTKIN
jgi:hypothetical protein